MLALLFFLTTVICAVGWLSQRISVLAILWYMDEEGVPLPSDEMIKRGCKWAASHMASDIISRRNRR